MISHFTPLTWILPHLLLLLIAAASCLGQIAEPAGAIVQGWGDGVASNVCQKTSVFQTLAGVNGHTYLQHRRKLKPWLEKFSVRFLCLGFAIPQGCVLGGCFMTGLTSRVPAHSTHAFYSVLLFKIVAAKNTLSPTLNRCIKVIPDKGFKMLLGIS